MGGKDNLQESKRAINYTRELRLTAIRKSKVIEIELLNVQGNCSDQFSSYSIYCSSTYHRTNKGKKSRSLLQVPYGILI